MNIKIALFTVLFFQNKLMYGQNIYQGGQGSGYAMSEILIYPNTIKVQKNISVIAPNFIDRNQNLTIVIPGKKLNSVSQSYILSDLLGRKRKISIIENSLINQFSITLSTNDLESGWYIFKLEIHTNKQMYFHHKFFIKP